MNIAIDEFGNPFVILKEQEQKIRLKGLEAQKSNILAAKSVTDTLKTSLGPKGMDKIIVSPDGQVTVTNDGATILDKMEVEHQCAKLLVDLSRSQDNEVGDGTTGVVILAGALLEEAYRLLEKGLHPLRITDGFDIACDKALKKMEEISVERDIFENQNEILLKSASTALVSKVVAGEKKLLSKIAVDAVLAVCDLKRKDVNFDLIKVQTKPGGTLSESTLINGIVIDKDISHSQMRKEVKDAKIAILTCPFEPPKPKTKHKLDIKTAEDFTSLVELEQKYFENMVQHVKKSGANFVICQWGFDDEANHLLMQNDLPSVRWVGGVELELIAIATNGRIVPRFEELTPEKLGHAASIREISLGTDRNEMIIIEGCYNSKAVTVVLKGGNQMALAEAERSLHDAFCCCRNLIRDSRFVLGGGACEIAASLAVEQYADTVSTIEQFAVRAFSDALMSIPQALAENCGFDPISKVSEAKATQLSSGNSAIGIDCMNVGTSDMSSQCVYESLKSKQHQLSLATQVVKMILKIDDIIAPDAFQK